MFGIKNIFTKSRKSITKSFNSFRGIIIGNPQMIKDLNETNEIQQSVLNNRYSSTLTVIDPILQNIASTCASIPMVVKNKSNDEIVENQISDQIHQFMENPSFKQQSRFQFVFAGIYEQSLCGYLSMLVDMKDKDNPQISIILSNQITVTNQGQNSLLISKISVSNLENKSSREDFYLTDKGYYVNKDKSKVIFASDTYFESLSNNVNALLSKSTLNINYLDIATILKIKQKNLFLVENKNEKNIAIVSNNNQSIMNRDAETRLAEAINRSNEKSFNGGTQYLFSTEPVSSNLLKLNDGNFTSQYDSLAFEAMKNIYRSYQYPIQKDLEQAKYDNSSYSQMAFVEQCLVPRLDYFYTVLTNLFAYLLKDDSFYISYDKNEIVEYQVQQANALQKNVSAYTVNEYRQAIGLETLKDERGNQLMHSNNNINDPSGVY